MFFVGGYSPLGLPKLFIGGKVSAANSSLGFPLGIDQGAAAFFQAADVGVAVVGFSVPPTGEINSHEFEGQRPDGGVVFFALALLVVIGSGPRLGFEDLAGIFVEA